MAEGKPAEALAFIEHARAIFEKVEGPESANVAAALSLGADSLGALGRRTEAIATLRRSVAIKAKISSPRQLAGGRFKLAQALRKAGVNPAEALALARDARAEFVREGAVGKVEVGEVDDWLAGR